MSEEAKEPCAAPKHCNPSGGRAPASHWVLCEVQSPVLIRTRVCVLVTPFKGSGVSGMQGLLWLRPQTLLHRAERDGSTCIGDSLDVVKND